MTKQTDTVIIHFLMIILMVFESLKTLLSLPSISLVKKTKSLPKKRTTTQLNKMLKRELIDLVIEYQ